MKVIGHSDYYLGLSGMCCSPMHKIPSCFGELLPWNLDARKITVSNNGASFGESLQ